jgi:hypothetical protein
LGLKYGSAREVQRAEEQGLNHIKEHVVLWYAAEVFRTADDATPLDLKELFQEAKSTEDRQALDRMLAEASLNVSLEAETAFASLPPVIERAIQLIQTTQPAAAPDPAAQAAMADIQMRAQVAAAQGQLDQQKLQLSSQQQQSKLQLDQAKLQGDRQLEQLREQAESQRSAADIQAKIAMNDADNRTAKELALLKITHGGTSTPSTNPTFNP